MLLSFLLILGDMCLKNNAILMEKDKNLTCIHQKY